MSRRTSLMICVGVYALALGAAAAVIWAWPDGPLWARIGAADIAATLVVFAASVAFNNSSIYDPYWSVAPVVIAAYLALISDAVVWRQVTVVVLMSTWGARLTLNWMQRWRGVADEDWRYVDLRRSTGRWYWLASLFGLHLLPTGVVYLGCAGAFAALHVGSRPLNWLDGLATVLAAVAIGLETTADRQLRHFLLRPRPAGAVLTTGLWSWSRHPNYFGEVLFWWAIAFFGVAATTDSGWVWLGPAAMTALFAFISLPLVERRSRQKAAWADYAARTSLIVPWPPRREAP